MKTPLILTTVLLVSLIAALAAGTLLLLRSGGTISVVDTAPGSGACLRLTRMALR